jgi:hypothetical protein
LWVNLFLARDQKIKGFLVRFFKKELLSFIARSIFSHEFTRGRWLIRRPENSKQRGCFFSKRLDYLRSRIEQAIGELKRLKSIAVRCEKTDASYSAIISFECRLILVKHVDTA